MRCAHLDNQPGRRVSARALKIARNAQASNLVGSELVGLATTWYFDNPCRNSVNQSLNDRRGGSAPCPVSVQKQDDFPEVLAQEFLLPEGERATHQCHNARQSRLMHLEAIEETLDDYHALAGGDHSEIEIE